MGYPVQGKKPAEPEVRRTLLGVLRAQIKLASESLPDSVKQALDFTGIDHNAEKTAVHLSGALRDGARELERQRTARQPAPGSGNAPKKPVTRPRTRDPELTGFQARRSELVDRLTAGKEANWLKEVSQAGVRLAKRVQKLAEFDFVSEMPEGQQALRQGIKLEATAESLHGDFVRYMSGLADEAGSVRDEDALAGMEDRAADLKGFFSEYGQHVLEVAAVVHAIVQSAAWKAAIPKGSGEAQQVKDAAFAVLKGIVPLAQGAIAKIPMAAEALAAVQVCIGGIKFCVDELDRSFGRMIRDAEIGRLQKEDPDLARRILNSDPALMARYVCDSQQAAVHRAFNAAGTVIYAIPEVGAFWPYIRTVFEGAINGYYRARVKVLERKLAGEAEAAGEGAAADEYVNGLEDFLDGTWEGSCEAIKDVILKAAGAGAEALAEKLCEAGLVNGASLGRAAGALGGVISGLRDTLGEIVPEAGPEAVKLITANLITEIIKYILGEMVTPAQPVTGDEIWAVLAGLREGAAEIPVLLSGSGGVYDEADKKGEAEYRREQARKAEEARQERSFQRNQALAAADAGITDLDAFLGELMSDSLDGSGSLDGWLSDRPSILAIYHHAGSPDRTVNARADLYAVAREALETSGGADKKTLSTEIAKETKIRILRGSYKNRIAYLIAQAQHACEKRDDDQARERMSEFEKFRSDWTWRLQDSVLTHDQPDEVINQILIPPAAAGGRQ
jgi:hypothetical protein